MTSCTSASVSFLSIPPTHPFSARSGYSGQFTKPSHLSLPSLSRTNSSTTSVTVVEEDEEEAKPSSTTGGIFTRMPKKELLVVINRGGLLPLIGGSSCGSSWRRRDRAREMTSCTSASVSFLSIPPTHPFSARSGYSGQFTKPSHLSLPSLSRTNSSTTSVTVVEEDEEEAKPSSTTGGIFTSGCKACGREEMEKGCNGEGSIQGGIATVPGFGWWPIKAYRPCPGFVASGGRYRRVGQSMDEVAFGKVEKAAPRVEKPIPLEIKDKDEPRKKKQGRRKLKR